MAQSKLTEWSERVLEHNGILFAVLTTIALSVGGAVELLPPILMSPAKTVTPIASVKPYSPLELTGRDIYIREGCYNCHSQMIRPFKWETDRFAGGAYGEAPYSKAGEFVYDHPFQWGSKRTGPDFPMNLKSNPPLSGTRLTSSTQGIRLRDPLCPAIPGCLRQAPQSMLRF